MDRRSITLGPAIAIAALLLLMVAAYTTAYLMLGKNHTIGDGSKVIRIYRSEMLMKAFKPAAAVDGAVTRREIEVNFYLKHP